MVRRGHRPAEVARRLGASRQAVHAWQTKWKNGGTQA
ncbi:helix-turn-helix domain-containing protein [Streptomyces noursei]